MPSLPRTKTRAATAGFKKPASAGTPAALSKPVTNWKLDAPERLLAKIATRVPGPGGSDEWVAAPHTPAQLFRETLHEVQTGAQRKARAAALANHLSQFTELPAIQSLVRNPVDERSLGALSDALLTHLGATKARVYSSGDIEGRAVNDFETLLRAGKIVEDPSGSVTLADPTSRFVFLGDLGDRGPFAWKHAKQLLSLATGPGRARVSLVIGNRDTPKLDLHSTLTQLADLDHPLSRTYATWLQKQQPAGSPNTPANRLHFFLSSRGGDEALEFHRQARSLELNRELSTGEAALHYIEQWRPDGVFYELSRLSNFVADPKIAGSKTVMTHGGLSPVAVASVPEAETVPNDLHGWIAQYRALGENLQDANHLAMVAGDDAPKLLSSLSKAVYSPAMGRGHDNVRSPVYAPRPHEGINYRADFPEVSAAKAKANIPVAENAHMPIGAVPELRVGPAGDAKVYNDTSRDEIGSQNIRVRSVDLNIMVGRVGPADSGTPVFWVYKPGFDLPYGKITSDDFAVVASTFDGRYLLSRYGPQWALQRKYVSAAELHALKPEARSPVPNTANEQRINAAVQELLTNNEWKTRSESMGLMHRGAAETTPISLEGIDAVRGNRLPILISSGEGGRHPVDDVRLLERGAQSVAETFGQSAVFFDSAAWREKPHEHFETLQMEALAKVNATRVGAIPNGTLPDSLLPAPQPGFLYTAAGHRDPAIPMQDVAAFAANRKGVAIFVGGDGSTARTLESVRSLKDLTVILVRANDEGRASASPRGASDIVAREAGLPAHFHTVQAKDLPNLGPIIKALVSRKP